MNDSFLQRAIQLSQLAVETGEGGPFGAVVVLNGKIIGESGNTIFRDHDPTAHAEVQAIRLAGKHLQSEDLTGAVLYTSSEPCSMCLSATYWAKIETVVYANSLEVTERCGIEDTQIYSELAKPKTSRSLIFKHFPDDKAESFLRAWAIENQLIIA